MNAEQAADLFGILSAARNSGTATMSADENVYVASIIARREAHSGNAAVSYQVRVSPGPGFDRAGGWAGLASLLEDGDHEVTWTPGSLDKLPMVEIRYWRKYERCSACFIPLPGSVPLACIHREDHALPHETCDGREFE